MNQKIVLRVNEAMNRQLCRFIPEDYLEEMRHRILAREMDRYEFEHPTYQFSAGLPEQWSDLIADFQPDYSNVCAICGGRRLG